MATRLRLVRGNVVLGTIALKPPDPNSPWRSGTFDPSAEYESVRELFEHELRLLQANKSDDPAQWEDWEDAHAELHDPGLRLEGEDKSLFADEILIHIDGSEAWWRVE
jgi:hypothetical protein